MNFLKQQRKKTNDRIDQGKAAEDARTDCEAGAEADNQNGSRRGRRILLGQANQAEHQDRHRNGERRILRVHEHMPVECRAQHQQQQGRKTGEGTADAPPQTPCHCKTDQTYDGAEQAAGLEQFERNDLVQQGRRHVEAAAIHVEIGERKCRGILEAGTVHAQQQIGIFSVGIVVPAEAVVAKCEARDQADRGQHDDGEVVASPLHRAPHRRVDGRSRYG